MKTRPVFIRGQFLKLNALGKQITPTFPWKPALSVKAPHTEAHTQAYSHTHKHTYSEAHILRSTHTQKYTHTSTHTQKYTPANMP